MSARTRNYGFEPCPECGVDKSKHAALCPPCAQERKNAQNRILSKARFEETGEIIRKAKSVPCMDCGNSYPPYVMDFDHRDPSTKVRIVGHMRQRSIQRLLNEIAKCDVVCANCHRERTHNPNRVASY